MNFFVLIISIWTLNACNSLPVADPKRTANAGEFPFHAIIVLKSQNNKFLLCEGVLLNKDYALTAAGCVQKYTSSPSSLEVVVGATSADHFESDKNAQTRGIISIDYPPQWSDSGHKYGDLAALKVSPPFSKSDYVSDVDDWEVTTVEDSLNLVGYGSDSDLTCTAVKTLSEQECKDGLGRDLSPGTFCVKPEEEEILNNPDYMGAPLASQNTTFKVVFAIYSQSESGVATSIPYYKEWLVDIVGVRKTTTVEPTTVTTDGPTTTTTVEPTTTTTVEPTTTTTGETSTTPFPTKTTSVTSATPTPTQPTSTASSSTATTESEEESTESSEESAKTTTSEPTTTESEEETSESSEESAETTTLEPTTRASEEETSESDEESAETTTLEPTTRASEEETSESDEDSAETTTLEPTTTASEEETTDSEEESAETTTLAPTTMKSEEDTSEDSLSEETTAKTKISDTNGSDESSSEEDVNDNDNTLVGKSSVTGFHQDSKTESDVAESSQTGVGRNSAQLRHALLPSIRSLMSKVGSSFSSVRKLINSLIP